MLVERMASSTVSFLTVLFFKKPVAINIGEIVFKEYKAPSIANDNCFTIQPPTSMGFWFCDLLPA